MNQASNDNWTPLHWATYWTGTLKNWPIFCKDNQRIVCFFYKDNNGTVDLLIKYGANVNAVNSDGDTALHFAAMNGNLILANE